MASDEENKAVEELISTTENLSTLRRQQSDLQIRISNEVYKQEEIQKCLLSHVGANVPEKAYTGKGQATGERYVIITDHHKKTVTMRRVE